jgi:hypothetical protein
MNVDLDIKGLKILVKGCSPDYSTFSNPLVIKAGHSYNDQYGRTDWGSLHKLSEAELYELYLICRNSWNK